MIFLASQSQQRARLLRKAGVRFAVVMSECNEEVIQHPQPQVLAVERARGKARGARVDQVISRHLPALSDPGSPEVILAADTIAALGTTIVGKPRDEADAIRILTLLQGTTHTVVTGHCCLQLDGKGGILGEAMGVALARVTMRSMSPDEIRSYVETGEGARCSGGYAIQETGDRFIVDLQGSWDTVVGLHIGTVARLYRECTDTPLPGYDPAMKLAKDSP